MGLTDLLDRVEMPVQLELFVYGGCGVCDRVDYMVYIGFQEGFRDVKGFGEYNCGCGATHSYDGLLRDLGGNLE